MSKSSLSAAIVIAMFVALTTSAAAQHMVVGVGPLGADVYAVGYSPRRVYRQAARLGYPPVLMIAPRGPKDFFSQPYPPARGTVARPPAAQPSWSGYDYRGLNGLPSTRSQFQTPRAGTPTPAPPQPSRSAPEAMHSVTPAPSPEPIPAPAGEL